MQQHVAWLTDADGEARLSDADGLQSVRGLICILVWAARHRHSTLCESTAAYFAQESPKSLHLQKYVDAQDTDGNTVLHALVLCGQVCLHAHEPCADYDHVHTVSFARSSQKASSHSAVAYR